MRRCGEDVELLKEERLCCGETQNQDDPISGQIEALTQDLTCLPEERRHEGKPRTRREVVLLEAILKRRRKLRKKPA